VKWRKRINAARKKARMGFTSYRLKDGTIKGLHTRDVLDAFLESIHGPGTARARVHLSAQSCISRSGGYMHELAQAVQGVPEPSTTSTSGEDQ